VIVAFEALHTMDVNLKGRKGYMAIKLDMSKAYDRVEWDYLEGIMKRIGFADRWIHLIMSCVRSVSYAILINGQPYGHIKPSRGIRQGDPLSPYLFILCAEGLSSLLNKAEEEGRISGLSIARGGTKINHLFFADDSLFFVGRLFPNGPPYRVFLTAMLWPLVRSLIVKRLLYFLPGIPKRRQNILLCR
jgi:hypothetical protein